MFGREQFERIWSNLLALGTKKLAALGAVGLAIIATIGFGSHYLSQPDMTTLYSGLGQQDVSRIGATLTEAGIAFDVSSDGTKVLVHPGRAAQARMLLAEKGLPSSSTAGYELFDKMGSMGLTSFMQEITRVRALEGELARTIQTIKGVKAARVHIVLPDNGSFRRDRQQATASVVVRADQMSEFGSAQAIRSLVAAAVPGMGVDQVKVVSTDGAILSTDMDGANAVPTKMIELERTVSKELQEKVKKTLVPYLGHENFEVSVAARLNMDKRQTNETTYDPKSRVERSLRVVREEGNSQNSNKASSVTVEQNVPEEAPPAAEGDVSKKSNERREELTNYELNTKTVQTESQGYQIDQLTVAVLVNRKRIAEASGSPVVTGAIEEKLKEVEALVKSAAGLDGMRGDRVTVAAVDFLNAPGALDPEPSGGLLAIALEQSGSVIRSLTILGVAALLILFGLRPVTRMLLETVPAPFALEAAGAGGAVPALTSADTGGTAGQPGLAPPNADDGGGSLADLTQAARRLGERNLERIIEMDEEQAATILKQWLREGKTG